MHQPAPNAAAAAPCIYGADRKAGSAVELHSGSTGDSLREHKPQNELRRERVLYPPWRGQPLRQGLVIFVWRRRNALPQYDNYYMRESSILHRGIT